MKIDRAEVSCVSLEVRIEPSLHNTPERSINKQARSHKKCDKDSKRCSDLRPTSAHSAFLPSAYEGARGVPELGRPRKENSLLVKVRKIYRGAGDFRRAAKIA